MRPEPGQVLHFSEAPRTMHHPVLALDFVAEVLRDMRRTKAQTL
ncbi:hypothetical protein [Streptomyces sp. NPDC006140]